MYSISTSRQCNQWELVQNRIMNNLKIFLFLLFLFVVNFAVLIYITVLFAKIIQANN